jgi:DNA-binding LytR/AlgR family response regulator
MKTVHIGSRMHVCPSRIKLLRADLNYTHVHFYDDNTQLVSTTLKILEERLSQQGFVRINRKEMVNREFVKAYRITPDRDYVELSDGSFVSPSRRGKRMLRDQFTSVIN